MVTREEMKAEALKRMEMLGLHENVVHEFEEGTLNYSDRMRMFGKPVGVLYWITPEVEKLVRDFEEQFGGMVYHLMHTNTSFGELVEMLFVSKYEEEWETDIEDIKSGEMLAYVYNLTYPEFSEFGHIGIKKAYGGLVREW